MSTINVSFNCDYVVKAWEINVHKPKVQEL